MKTVCSWKVISASSAARWRHSEGQHNQMLFVIFPVPTPSVNFIVFRPSNCVAISSIPCPRNPPSNTWEAALYRQLGLLIPWAQHVLIIFDVLANFRTPGSSSNGLSNS